MGVFIGLLGFLFLFAALVALIKPSWARAKGRLSGFFKYGLLGLALIIGGSYITHASMTDEERQALKERIEEEKVQRLAESEANAKQKKLEADERESRRAAEKAEAEQKAESDRIAALNEKAAEQQREEAEAFEKNRKGFHCLSGWDGSQRHVVNAVKEALNDPGSFDHISTVVAPVNNNRHTFKMEYRAKNGFGALIKGTATGTYGNKDCADVNIISYQ